MSNNLKQRLIDSYVNYLIENMSVDAMKCLVNSQLKGNFDSYTLKELLEEIQEDVPEFLTNFKDSITSS